MTDTSDTIHDEPPYDKYIMTLEGIDTLAYNLLEAINDDDTLTAETKQQATRRLREIRAEVDPLLLTFRQQTDDEQTIPRRGLDSKPHCGTDPVAFEHSQELDEEDDG